MGGFGQDTIDVIRDVGGFAGWWSGGDRGPDIGRGRIERHGKDMQDNFIVNI